MRELIVLRHAKSSWDDIDKRDHDRQLASRGIEAAKRMGALILERGWVPDHIICSTAARTQQTLELARADWPTDAADRHDHAGHSLFGVAGAALRDRS